MPRCPLCQLFPSTSFQFYKHTKSRDPQTYCLLPSSPFSVFLFLFHSFPLLLLLLINSQQLPHSPPTLLQSSLMDSASDLTPTPYTPLPDHHLSPPLPRKSLNFTTATILISLLLLLVSLLTLLSYHTPSPHATQSPPPFRLARGVAEGVSAKSNPSFSDSVHSFNWTNAMFSWQRTAFHFQPEGNWMNGNFNSISDPPLLFSLHYIYNNDTNFKILLWVFFFCGF